MIAGTSIPCGQRRVHDPQPAHAAVDRLHHHDGHRALAQDLVLLARRSEEPVVVVELNLNEVPLPTVEHGAERLGGAVEREAQPAQGAPPALLLEVLLGTVVEVVRDEPVRDTVKQVEVYVTGPQGSSCWASWAR